jgi:hypothetical protein
MQCQVLDTEKDTQCIRQAFARGMSKVIGFILAWCDKNYLRYWLNQLHVAQDIEFVCTNIEINLSWNSCFPPEIDVECERKLMLK